MARVDEIAPNLFRISVYAGAFDLQFNHFLVRDDEPLLFHTGLRGMFPEVRDAVARLIDLKALRHISFSHFESDECGSLNEWLAAAPGADVICSQLGSLVSVNDFVGHPVRGLADGGRFTTGTLQFRYLHTPHLPHGWDAGVLFEETRQTLLCSDLFHQVGDVEALTESDLIGRTRASLEQYQGGPLADYVPYTPLTRHHLERLADLQPQTLAIMHGSSFRGPAAQPLRDLDQVFGSIFGRQTE